jgi:SAM-dependent methyltransferase
MALDVTDLRAFYSSPLGQVASRFVGRIVMERWENCAGLSLMGLGYAPPYFQPFRERAMRLLSFMPAEQGVVTWPASGGTASALVDTTMLPLPDSSIDRILLVHALEVSSRPREMLEEIWRVLTPGGKMIAVVPNRGGLWARVDRTPFGHGLPYSRSQLRALLRETEFLPVHWAEALYVPPFARPYLLRTGAAFERIGSKLALPGSGVHLVEATKQLYRPIAVRRSMRRVIPQLAPAPMAGRISEARPIKAGD